MASVLVVDDNSDLTEVVRDFLEAEGHDVRVAHDGLEGLALVHDRAPDVVITDIEMPKLDGPGMAVRMLLEDCGLESIPVLLVSGAADLAATARILGTPYAIAKPCPPDRLLSELARALRERKPPDPAANVVAEPGESPARPAGVESRCSRS